MISEIRFQSFLSISFYLFCVITISTIIPLGETIRNELVWPTLEVGDSGLNVSSLRNLLGVIDQNFMSYDYEETLADIGTTAKFSSKMQQLVLRFQAIEGLESTGRVDSMTWKMLLEFAMRENLYSIASLVIATLKNNYPQLSKEKNFFVSNEDCFPETILSIPLLHCFLSWKGDIRIAMDGNHGSTSSSSSYLIDFDTDPYMDRLVKFAVERIRKRNRNMEIDVLSITEATVKHTIYDFPEQWLPMAAFNTEKLYSMRSFSNADPCLRSLNTNFCEEPIMIALYHVESVRSTQSLYSFRLHVRSPLDSKEIDQTHTFQIEVKPPSDRLVSPELKLISEIWDSNEISKRQSIVSSLKVMTYNIWNYNSNWDRRKLMIADVIQDENPDLIGWQEIREKWNINGSNQLQQLADVIPGYQWIYATAMQFPSEQMEEGLGIFIREGISIRDWEVVRLPRNASCSDLNTRILLRVLLDFGDGILIHFIDTHWSYDRECQVENALKSWDVVSQLNNSQVTFMVADFNTYNDYTLPTDFLTGKAVINGKTGDFTDIWTKLMPLSQGYTFQTWLPQVRPDRILLRGSGLNPNETKVVGFNHNGEQYCSDHASVVAKGAFSLLDGGH